MGYHGRGRLAQRHLSGKPEKVKHIWKSLTSARQKTPCKYSPCMSQCLSGLSPLQCTFAQAFLNCNPNELTACKKLVFTITHGPWDLSCHFEYFESCVA